jgi:hypothetical protein
MALASDYEQRVLSYGWEQLRDLWQGIEARNTIGWDPGKALEYMVLRAFELEGVEVTYPYSVVLEDEELEQIDGALYVNGLACIVECKDLAGRVNIEPIAKMRNQLLRRPASAIGVVFSHGGFTSTATTLARYIAPQTVLLWTGEEIGYALDHCCFSAGLTRKYRACVEQGVPNYNIQPESSL